MCQDNLFQLLHVPERPGQQRIVLKLRSEYLHCESDYPCNHKAETFEKEFVNLTYLKLLKFLALLQLFAIVSMLEFLP